MGTPEWEDADFDGDVEDPFFPDWWNVDLKGFNRPPWFAQGRLPTCQSYLLAHRRGDRLRASLLWRQLRLEQWLRCRSTAPARTLGALLGVAHGWEVPSQAASAGDVRQAHARDVTDRARRATDTLRRGIWRTRRRGFTLVHLVARKSAAAVRAARVLVLAPRKLAARRLDRLSEARRPVRTNARPAHPRGDRPSPRGDTGRSGE